MIVPVVAVVEGNADQRQPVAPRRADETAPRGGGIARLAADAVGVERERAVVVGVGHVLIGRRDKVHRAGSSRGETCESFVFKRRRHQQRHIVCGGVVIGVVKPARGHKMGASHAELTRALVHQARKALRAAGYRNRSGVRRVVAGAHHHAHGEVAQLNALAEPEIHRAALGGHLVGEGDRLVMRRRAFKGDQRGHQLGGARGLHPLVGVVRQQHLAVVGAVKHKRPG